MGNKATATKPASTSGLMSPPVYSPRWGGSSSAYDESKYQDDVEEPQESSESTEDEGEDKAHIQSIVMTGPARKDNAELVKKLLGENTAAGYDVKMVNNDKMHASECSLPMNKWKIQVPRSWRTFAGDRCKKATIVVFTCNIGSEDFSDTAKSTASLSKKMEFMLSEYEELSRQPWVRKCAMVVCVTKIPPETVSGSFADVEFKNRAELMDFVKGCFLVKSPKFWNALIFKTCESILDIDWEMSVLEAKKKFSKDEENSLDRTSMYSGSKVEDSHKLEELSIRSSMFSGSRGASLSMSDFNLTGPMSGLIRLPSGPHSASGATEPIETM